MPCQSPTQKQRLLSKVLCKNFRELLSKGL
uniref:Uncharacterized protein n=1 Tax=Salmonella phage vB_SEnST11_KE22 TaxID=3161173 RepID=A0AAU8GHA6_9CAUD